MLANFLKRFLHGWIAYNWRPVFTRLNCLQLASICMLWSNGNSFPDEQILWQYFCTWTRLNIKYGLIASSAWWHCILSVEGTTPQKITRYFVTGTDYSVAECTLRLCYLNVYKKNFAYLLYSTVHDEKTGLNVQRRPRSPILLYSHVTEDILVASSILKIELCTN
jgi:hypothetical protein